MAVRSLFNLAMKVKGAMTPEEVELRPLSPTVAGGFPTKKGAVECFRGLARYAGSPVRVTGHMPRVAGAIRMAKAGLEIWKIQLFCRWGSAVVLRYIRSAPLEDSHRWSGQVARGLELKDIKAKVEDEVGKTKGHLDKDLLLQCWRPALEDLKGSVLLQLSDADAGWKQLFGAIESRLATLEDAPSRSLPKYVGNAAPHAVALHVPRNHMRTFCGWVWGGNVFSMPKDRKAPDENLCKKCDRELSRRAV